MRSTLFFAPAALVLLTAAAGPVVAASFYVTTPLDTLDGTCDSHCSLRDAVVAANADTGTVDTIYLQAERYELTIPGVDENHAATGDLNLMSSLRIVGKGPRRTIIDANSIDRVFKVATNGVDILIRGVTITGGWLGPQAIRQGSGIDIIATDVTVTLETCILEENYSTSSDLTHGGGIFTRSNSLTIRHTMIRNNSAGRGSAIAVISDTANVVVERSTIYGNTSFDGRGSVYSSDATVVIDTSTVSYNYGSSGSGGVYNIRGTISIIGSTLSGNAGAQVVATYDGGGLVTLNRTIIDGYCTVEHDDAIESKWFNLESPGNTCGLLAIFDKFNVVDSKIDYFHWNGGPTLTQHPQPLSPVVDPTFSLVQPSCPDPDQRGVSRPRDGESDPDTDPECDIGAVERAPGSLFFDDFECAYTTAWSTTVP